MFTYAQYLSSQEWKGNYLYDGSWLLIQKGTMINFCEIIVAYRAFVNDDTILCVQIFWNLDVGFEDLYEMNFEFTCARICFRFISWALEMYQNCRGFQRKKKVFWILYKMMNAVQIIIQHNRTTIVWL